MAEKKPYTSIIDAFLDSREPDWKELDLADAQKSGEEQLDRTHQYADKDFMDEIAESASRHTPIWSPKSGSHTYEERISEKEAAAPRVNSVKADWRKDARRDNDAYNTEMGDNDQLMNEVCMTLDQAGTRSDLKENSADKKAISDEKVFKYVKDLLNQGVSPSKVAAKLEKLAELELFNHQSATDYLQRTSSEMGLAYLEPNTYMDKNSPTYERTAGAKESKVFDTSTEEGLKAAEKYKAHLENKYNSVKTTPTGLDRVRIEGHTASVVHTAASKCTCGESKFITEAGHRVCKNCGKGAPPNSQAQKEAWDKAGIKQVVNNLTPGVPKNQKHAALVSIANGEGKRAHNAAQILAQTKRASSEFKDEREVSKKFSSEHVAKMHFQGASLERIYKWAEPKFGSIDVSFAFRGFVQSLKKDNAGKVVVASADLKFLNAIGIRNASFEGKEKCASCPDHFNRVSREIVNEQGVARVDGKFAQRTPDAIRNGKTAAAEVVVTASKVRMLHQAGHSIQKIYNGAASKVGSVQAKKAIAGFVEGMKKTPGKIAVSEQDRAFLVGKLGFKPEAVRMLDPQRRPVTQVVATVSDETIGMKHASAKTVTDGMAILAEYDLTSAHDMQDIDTSGHKLEDIEMGSTFRLEE